MLKVAMNQMIEVKRQCNVNEGDVVCFYHAKEYLGQGVIIQLTRTRTFIIQLDRIALSNFEHYSYRLFDFMMLDHEVEMIFDEY